jgi:hypothetical protein
MYLLLSLLAYLTEANLYKLLARMTILYTLVAIQAIQYKVVYDDEEIMSAAQAIQQNTLVHGQKLARKTLQP